MRTMGGKDQKQILANFQRTSLVDTNAPAFRAKVHSERKMMIEGKTLGEDWKVKKKKLFGNKVLKKITFKKISFSKKKAKCNGYRIMDVQEKRNGHFGGEI